MRFLGIDLDLLTPAERRDLANALLRAAWSAALEDTRILLLDLSSPSTTRSWETAGGPHRCRRGTHVTGRSDRGGAA